MKRALFLLIFSLISIQSFSKEVLILSNHQQFLGEVVDIKKEHLIFKSSLNEDFEIPIKDISLLASDRLRVSRETMVSDSICLKGIQDAKLYHKGKGWYILVGFITGPIGIIATAFGNPTPMKAKIDLANFENKKYFDNPEYLRCYKKTVIKRRIGNGLIGFGLFFVAEVALLFYAIATFT